MRFLRYSQNQVQQQYKKSGKKLDMGKGCVRFKSLDDLALDTRGSASGSGTRQRTRMSHAKREVGGACALLLVQRRSTCRRRGERSFWINARSRGGLKAVDEIEYEMYGDDPPHAPHPLFPTP